MIKIKYFPDYFFSKKKLFRRAYKTKSKSCKWQYRAEREIKQVENNNIKGYLLRDKNNKRVFVSVEKMKKFVKL